VKNRLIVGLQALVTVGLLGWLFSQPEIRQGTAEVLRGAHPLWLLAAVLIAGVENFIGLLRWRIFLRLVGIELPFWESARLFYFGLFCNFILVGAVGGDSVKVLVLIGQGYRKSAAVFSVLLDRLSGVAALVLTSVIFISWHYDWLVQSRAVSGLIQFVFIYLGVVVFFLALSFVAARTGFAENSPKWLPFRERLDQLCRMYWLMLGKWRSTLFAAGLSCLMLLGYFAVFFAAMRAFDLELSLGQVFAFMPAVDIITAMPISLGGVGVREKLFKVLLGDLAGASGATAVWVSLSGYLATLFWGVVGLLAWPFFKGFIQRARKTPDLLQP
jgi:glycosyltransferase 2 family protein